MAFHIANSVIVMFGGAGTGTFFGDTWAWDGTEWTQVQDLGPSPRELAAMALEFPTSRLVLFGGAGPNGAGLDDTWSWDGATWSQVGDTGPEPRAGMAAELDALDAGGGVILFGGVNSVDPALPGANRVVYGDTWRWAGGNWTKVQDIGPGPRWGHALTHRSEGARNVVFGGSSGFAPPQSAELAATLLGDTWERPFAVTPTGGQPQPGGPPGVDVTTVQVMPQTVPIGGGTLDVTASLSGPAPVDLPLAIAIFFDAGGGQYAPAQPPGFDVPQVVVQSGAVTTQFTIARNADPIQPGNYAIGVGVQGGQMQGAFFTVV